VAVSFIGGENRSTRRKPQTCHKSLTNSARLGLYTHGNRCLSGKEVENMSDDELSHVIDKVTVLYRTTPKNKNKIVRVSTDDIM
jgi:magnesium-transporting ATPase (P-type)